MGLSTLAPIGCPVESLCRLCPAIRFTIGAFTSIKSVRGWHTAGGCLGAIEAYLAQQTTFRGVEDYRCSSACEWAQPPRST